MKFTSKDLAIAMGLSIGDKIKTDITTLEVKESTFGTIYLEDIEDGDEYDLPELVDVKFEILPRPKRVGDLICEKIDCEICPMNMLNCLQYDQIDDTLYIRLKRWNEKFNEPVIYNLIKPMMDEVVQNESSNT